MVFGFIPSGFASEAEPNSLGFYEKMGAVHVRDQIGDWGRTLPVMSLPLT
jgi:hypothetical protein